MCTPSLVLLPILLLITACAGEPNVADPVVPAPPQDGGHEDIDLADAPGASGDWATTVQSAIRDGQYQLRIEDDGSLGFRNPKHGLSARMTSDGAVDVVAIETADAPPSAGLAPLNLSLRTVAWGRGEAMRDASEPDVLDSTCTSDGRVDPEGKCLRQAELHRDGLVEWWVNAPDGLEQGWTVLESPAGQGELAIEVAVDGAEVVVEEDGSAAVFSSGDRRLRYGSLAAWDADGAALAVWMEWTERGLRVLVDDAGARYPVVVDPVLATAEWTAESNQADAYFGWSVASAGDVNGDGYGDVVAGAYNYTNGQSAEGRAFVYLGSASGLSSSAAWTAESNQADAYFGSSVASAGDVNRDGYGDVVVGAFGYDNGQSDEGRVFVYLGSASGLSTSAAWTAESNQAGAYFGRSVVSAGDVNGDGYGDVVVGAPEYDKGQANEGRAFVYLGGASGLATSAAWTAESNQEGASFGTSVASAGDVNGDGYGDVVVGASLYDNGQSNEGRAFVYLGSAAGLSSSAAWTAESNKERAYFGFSVASAGDVNGDGFGDVVVGAPAHDNVQVFEGRAFVYLGSASGLSTSAAWTAESDQNYAQFGWSVASAGDENGDGYDDVVVGAREFRNGQSQEGRAFVYQGGASGLSTSAGWTAESNKAEAQLGSSVASAGDVNGDGYDDVVVGAPYFTNGQANEGRVFVYLGSGSRLPTGAEWTLESNHANAQSGSSVASAGDVNGDGYGDVVVGVPLYDGGQNDEGRAYVYLGSASGLATSAAWAVESDQVGAELGSSVASAGDVNGDGYGDVVVGAPLYNNGNIDEGRAFVYLGSASGLSTSAAWTAESDQFDAQLGSSVASAGDVNGDGYGDVVVGAPLYNAGQSDEGRAFVYLGSASGLSTSAVWTGESNQVEAGLGTSVASAGDVNGDGYGDVVVGAPGFDNGQQGEGRAFVYLGSASGLSQSAAWTAEVSLADAGFGTSVAAAGDVNGDGYGDVVVGVPGFDNGQAYKGRAFVYLGSASGLSQSAAWTALPDQASAEFGVSVASAGDVNGDGYGDVVVGAPDYDNGQQDEGRAFVYLGSASGLSTSAAWTVESNQAAAACGVSVASAGDVDGDGFGELVVGAPGYDNGQTNEGRALVYQGRASGLSTSAAWTVESDQANAELSSVASAGDVNGDGYGDVVVGASRYDNGQVREGRAFLYLGSASGLSTSAAWTAESNQAEAFFGGSVASAGDVNGDGYGDVVVGAVWYENGEVGEGRAFVYLGSASGLSTSAAWTAEPDQVDAFFGGAVASAGDVNGDGYGDVVVGALAYDNGEDNEGRAFVYLGSASGLSTSAAWTAESDQVGARLGVSVASAGDVNGDGYGDVVVGAYAYDNGEFDEGRAFVYLGSASGLSTSAAWTAESDQVNAFFGLPVASAGDVNGDGYGDVVVGASAYDNGEFDEGAAFVYLGSASGLSTSATWTLESDHERAYFGRSVASAGDVNRDGYGDVVVGARWYEDNGQFDEGRVFVYLGSASGLATNAAWTVVTDQAGAEFGQSVASAGDVNGDGYGDLLVGAPEYDKGQTNEGRVFVYLGNGGDGTGAALPLAAQAQRPGGSIPIAPGGWSAADGAFDVRGRALRSPFGRGRVRLAVESKPRGTPFDGLGLVRSSQWVDSGVAGVGREVRLTGLGTTPSRHWRVRVEYDPSAGTPALWSPWSYGGRSGDAQGSHVVPATKSPVAVADVDTVAEGGTVSVAVLANDSDPDSTLAYAGVSIRSEPTHGTAVVGATGIEYTHDGSETTADSFTYRVNDGSRNSNTVTVSITVTPANDAPVAVADSGTVAEGGVLSIAVLANDSDPDSTLAYAGVSIRSEPTHGTAVVGATGIEYTHDGSETTTDSFTYRVNDGTRNSNTVTVSITVTPGNDAPIAVADSRTVAEGGVLSIAVLANDSDPDSTLAYAGVSVRSAPSHGTAVVGPTGVTYTHDGSETTADSFTYRVNDGTRNSNTVTVSITVTPVNDAPVAVADGRTVAEGGALSIAVLANDTDPDSTLAYAGVSVQSSPTHGTAVVGATGITYTHDGSETTADSFTYRVNDGTRNSNTVTVSITVTPVNDAPVAVADNRTVAEGGALSIAVLGNDTDPDSTLAYTRVAIQSLPTHGTVVVGPAGVTYTHNGSETTADSFTYRVNDGTRNSNTVTVSIAVTPVNDAPVAVADVVAVAEGGTLSIAVLANDVDPDSTLAYASVNILSLPTHGTAVLGPTGITYTHDGTETTADSFTYRVNDGSRDSNTVTVSIAVTSVNGAPVAVADVDTVAEGATVSIGVLANDVDPDSTLAYARVAVQSSPTHGTAVVGATGIEYTHNGSETTADSFTYRVSDGSLTRTRSRCPSRSRPTMIRRSRWRTPTPSPRAARSRSRCSPTTSTPTRRWPTRQSASRRNRPTAPPWWAPRA